MPEMLRLRTVNCRIDHQHSWEALDGLACGELLVALAPVAPATGLILSFDACFENLCECGALEVHWWLHRLILKTVRPSDQADE